MSKIQVKAFVISKDGSINTCQDSLAINASNGCFAVADGVTNSYHPEILSQLLCKSFVEFGQHINVWYENFDQDILSGICREWDEIVGDIESSLNGRKLDHALIKRNNLPKGASTFAGIHIDTVNQNVEYCILGDSTLFVLDNGGNIQALCTNDTIAGGTMINYTNHPHYIGAEGIVHGQWILGKFPISSGFLMLMTDGCAEWFQEAYSQDKTTAEQLWRLQNNGSFEGLASTYRQKGQMDDDLTMILIRISDTVKDIFEVLAFPDFPKISYRAGNIVKDTSSINADITFVPTKYSYIDFETLSSFK